ncbi:hypothetical protein K8T06_07995, partial [bacterium]|nr:hypothetical protein [bacterium]
NDWSEYDRFILAVSNIGDGVHDPDDDDWIASGYLIRADHIPSVTPTPDLCTATGLILQMPDHHFNAGDNCWLSAYICNRESDPLTDHIVLVVLEAYGQYLFAPGWGSDLDCYVDSFERGLEVFEIVPHFPWSSDVGTADNIYFHGALLDPVTIYVLGQVDSWEFGWG